MKAVPVDWKKLIDVVDNWYIKNTKLNTQTKVNNLEKEIPDTTTLIHINKKKHR